MFLVDTYDTLEGTRRAVEIGRKLRQNGHDLLGIRLDSGDLAYLSIEARKILDAGGFPDAKIYASNDLDEQTIASLKEQGAQIGVWGVGTRLVTGNDQPALGGVYKLSATRAHRDDPWQPRIKLSEQTLKISNPGVLGVRRYYDVEGGARQNVADAIYDVEMPPRGGAILVDPQDAVRRRRVSAKLQSEELLVPAMRGGKRVKLGQTRCWASVWIRASAAPLSEARARAGESLAAFAPGIKRFTNPHRYPAGLEVRLHEKKMAMVERAMRERLERETNGNGAEGESVASDQTT